ncbi:hypothetical protein C8J56DRAFT_1064473 [Mycena floridula]|nr:hypothetical protein C8J56DRAFT_1064473 [Mycena floridula]
MAVEGHSCAVVGGFLGDEVSWVVVGIRISLWKQGGDTSRREEEGGICKTSGCLPRIDHAQVQPSPSLSLSTESRPLRSVDSVSSFSLGGFFVQGMRRCFRQRKEGGLVFAFGEIAFSGYLKSMSSSFTSSPLLRQGVMELFR